MIDRLIGLSTGFTLLFGSVSGLKCVNSCRSNRTAVPLSTMTNNTTCETNNNNKNCSRVNMNLGLVSMGLTGGLLVYKHLSK